MKKIILSLLISVMLVMSVSLVMAKGGPTPADTIKDGTTVNKITPDGGRQVHVSNVLGLNHCVFKPMYDKNGELTSQRSGWAVMGPYWFKCNGFGPK